MTTPLHKVPEILAQSGPLLARYDVLFCDVWGVVHDGRRAFDGANDALTRFRAGGGTVVLVSNAPMPSETVARVLADKGVTRRAFDAIVCSGDLALAHIAEAGYASIHRIGPMPRDASFFDRLPGPHAEISTADAIACTGLAEDRRQSAEDYRQLLEQALARRLPLVCANPDLAVHVGADLLPCAGAVAALYESLGGPVVWAGKPHAGAFRRAHEVAEGLRRTAVPKARILAIGDALRTDLAAAERHGIDALFVAAGIHRHEVMAGDAIDPEGLARLFAGGGPSALAATAGLVW